MIGEMLIAGVGGFVGKCGRYLTGVLGKKLFGDKYPAGTFMANVFGCFIIGLFYGLWGRHEMGATVNALLITGFYGGYTTFSSFSHDGYSLLKKGEYVKFILYVVPSVALGLLMVWVGMECVGYSTH